MAIEILKINSKMNNDDKILDDNFILEWNSNIQYQYASTWKRFANYIIDLLFVYLLFSFLTFVYEILTKTTIESNSYFSTEKLFLALLLIIYYIFLEFYFKGITLGKLFTKTKAITEENTNLNIEHAVIRSVARLIPFDHLSFLFGDDNDTHEFSIGWHDKISNTRVIDLKLPIRNTETNER